jgi:hypothetical protein
MSMAYNSFPIRLIQTQTIQAGAAATFGPVVVPESACMVQATVHGDQSFVTYIDGSPDGSNWYTIERNFAADLSSDGSPRYAVPVPSVPAISAFRQFRVRVKNSDASDPGTFTVAICVKE